MGGGPSKPRQVDTALTSIQKVAKSSEQEAQKSIQKVAKSIQKTLPPQEIGVLQDTKFAQPIKKQQQNIGVVYDTVNKPLSQFSLLDRVNNLDRKVSILENNFANMKSMRHTSMGILKDNLKISTAARVKRIINKEGNKKKISHILEKAAQSHYKAGRRSNIDPTSAGESAIENGVKEYMGINDASDIEAMVDFLKERLHAIIDVYDDSFLYNMVKGMEPKTDDGKDYKKFLIKKLEDVAKTLMFYTDSELKKETPIENLEIPFEQIDGIRRKINKFKTYLEHGLEDINSEEHKKMKTLLNEFVSYLKTNFTEQYVEEIKNGITKRASAEEPSFPIAKVLSPQEKIHKLTINIVPESKRKYMIDIMNEILLLFQIIQHNKSEDNVDRLKLEKLNNLFDGHLTILHKGYKIDLEEELRLIDIYINN